MGRSGKRFRGRTFEVARGEGRGRGGFTMMELCLAMTILVVALVATTASNMRMHTLRRSNHDRVLAHNAVQSIAENVQALARAGVDDPSGFGNHVVAALSAGGTLGATFDVPGLTPVEGAVNVGSIRVVTDETTSDEDVGAQVSLPRDLNGDGDALDTNVVGTAHLLPIVITLRWRSQAGDQRVVHPFYVSGF